MKTSLVSPMRSDLELDKELSKLDLPDLIALLHRIADEIELRLMESEAERNDRII